MFENLEIMSMAQAIRMTAPLMMKVVLPEMPKNSMPLMMSCISSTPRMTPEILPMPPTKETPPMTQAAMASNS